MLQANNALSAKPSPKHHRKSQQKTKNYIQPQIHIHNLESKSDQKIKQKKTVTFIVTKQKNSRKIQNKVESKENKFLSISYKSLQLRH